MKVLLSADWHIKIGQKNVPKEWQRKRYTQLYNKIHELEKEVDIHIIGGDIFDNIPKPEELSMYFEFLSGVTIPTFIFDGNHEATRKGQTFMTHLAEASNNINSNVTVINGITEIHDIDIIPYTHLKKFNPKDFHNRILCTHVRGEIPPHVIPEVDLDIFDRWDVVLAGDLHSYDNCQRNILYPGSPLSITFHRKKISNGVIIFDTETLEHEWIDLGLPQLIRLTVDSEADIIKTTYDHTIYEITGNLLELSNVDVNSDIIDKKIVSKTKDAILDLAGLTVSGELELYCKDILNLSDEETKSIIKVYNDYIETTNLE